MATTRRSSAETLGIASIVWLAVSVSLLAATGVLAWKLFFGADYRAQALKDVQRIEFDVVYDNGNAIPQNLLGETLTLETALAMGEAANAIPQEPDTAPPAEASTTEAPAAKATTEPANPDIPAVPDGTAKPEPAAPVQQQTQEVQQPSASTAGNESSSNASTLAPVEKMTDKGIIPAIAADGTKPWQYFAMKDYAKGTDRPRIAIIIQGLGLARMPTESAIALPAEVTLSFSPYGRETTMQLAQDAREAGHEIMLDLPMQTERYPAVDPGPYAIRTDLTAAENHDRLMTVLTKARGYVGLLAPARDVVTLDRNLTAPLIDGFAGQGLLFVSGHSQQPEGMFRLTRQAGVPILFTDVLLDGETSETHIRNQLARAEDVAHNKGKAVVVGHAYPITLELLESWTRELAAKGYTLVPVSALGKMGA